MPTVRVSPNAGRNCRRALTNNDARPDKTHRHFFGGALDAGGMKVPDACLPPHCGSPPIFNHGDSISQGAGK